MGGIGPEHEWFTDYLRNQIQVVEFHGVTSNPEGVSIGVPQGSILVPLLFILHVNDLPEAASECSILVYTDNTVLFCSSSQTSTFEEPFKIECWLLVIVFLLISQRLKSCFLGPLLGLPVQTLLMYTLMAHKLRVHEFSYLGVVFDERLSWGSHVKKMISKAGKHVGMLGRLCNNLMTHCANVIYLVN